MSRKPKDPKVAGFMRTVVAENLKRLAAHYWPGLGVTKTWREVAAKTGVKRTTVERIWKAESGTSLDNLEILAEGCEWAKYF